jgi:Domain of unknown function (DUF4352)
VSSGALVGVALLAMFLSACSFGGADNGQVTVEQRTVVMTVPSELTTSAITKAPTTPSTSNTHLEVGDTANLPSGQVTVYSFDSPVEASNQLTKPDPGFEFSVIDAEFCADPKLKDTSVNPASFTLQMPDNTSMQPKNEAREPALQMAELSPDACARGFVTFQTPQGVRPKFVIFYPPGEEQPIKWAV